MRIISRRRLREFWEQHPDAEVPLTAWHKLVEEADWANFAQLRRVFPHADQVSVKSGNTVTVFNIRGNKYRLVCSVVYPKHLVFTLMVMTHADYDREKWKDQL